VAEQEPWHAPTGLSGLAEPAQLWWWTLAGHAGELTYLLADLNLTPEQRRQVLRLQQVHIQEVATLAGYPDCPLPVAGKVTSAGTTPDERPEPRAPHPG
jgi:hypothetical protein